MLGKNQCSLQSSFNIYHKQVLKKLLEISLINVHKKFSSENFYSYSHANLPVAQIREAITIKKCVFMSNQDFSFISIYK